MQDLVEKIYCSEHIHIPPTFPYIMKLYCKAAIRTQPYDLLKWSAAYFRALANGEEPPVKERIEYPPYDSPSGLTPGFIKILINQFGKDPDTTITARTLFSKWSDICLQEQLLIKLIALLGATTTVNWVKFVGVCAGFISKTLTQTMILICELFTEEPEGGMATIPYTLFVDLYIFLAQMDCGPLTDQEREELEAIMYEEDICEIADKIKQGIYEAEAEGEFEFVGEQRENLLSVEMGVEEENAAPTEEETFQKESEISAGSEITAEEREEGMGDQKDDETFEDFSIEHSENSSSKGIGSSKTFPESHGEVPIEFPGEKIIQETKKEEEKPSEEDKTDDIKTDADSQTKKINLMDMEESIRNKIEQKLAEDKESYEEEEDREFEDLSSYLLGAAARVQKYTSEALGYRVFKKYLRQDVPGIGPVVEPDQVEKVVDFMDFWSHKQEEMVMPRNIRHWMCPPLDKILTPEP